MTSPRTPRQWTEDDTIPDDVEQVRDVHGRIWSQQWLRMDDGSTQWRLPGTRFGSSTESVTRAFGPVSEVLPETPEPPREDEDLFPSALAEHCYFEGCPEWITGSSDYCPEHAKLYAPVPASQSVPAAPVSSTGGKETGEAAEDAQGAAEADWTEESRFADFREAYDYATIHFSAAIRAHAKVDRREAYQIWHTIQLGMEKIQRERSPLPDSETEWGYRRVGEPDSYTRRTTEAAARDTAARASTGPWVVCKRTAAGPWIEVGS